MNYSPLGKSNLQVSDISMGCMSLKEDKQESARTIHKAIDLGINFFDTADLYDRGQNEILLGEALGSKRADVILATKVGNQWNVNNNSWSWNPRKKYILTAVEESLKRLNTDYIDLYQLHGGTIEDPIDETIEAFDLLKEQGKIREYGISSIRPNVIREYVQRSNIVSVMMQYSLLDRRPEELCLGLLKTNDISVITRGTLAKGLLVNKSPKPYLGHAESEVKVASDAIQMVADIRGKSKSLVACQYVLQSETVASAVIGFRTEEQLLDCVDGSDIDKLADLDYEFLLASAFARKYEGHR
jgi:aryl-alcohol dehydrogenase-like predicted oxidoreductase